jgi:hypothetical protein
MKIQLQKLEARIRDLIEVKLVDLLPGEKVEKAAVHQLATAIYANIHEQKGVTIAPNIFTLVINPIDQSKWRNPRILDTLKDSILVVGQEANLKFASPPTLSVATDNSLAPGEVKVIASIKMEMLESTNSISKDAPAEEEDVNRPENAFLIIDGRKLFPLTTQVINIGRRLENNLTIDDPRVSRTHAQLRSINGRYVIFDLNSTGGTFINGKRISQTILYPGDVISLAGVNLVYGQDNPLPRPDLKDTGPLNPDPLDRKTAIFNSPSDFLKPQK